MKKLATQLCAASVVLAMAVGLLTGCGSKNAEKPANSAEQSTSGTTQETTKKEVEKTKITVWSNGRADMDVRKAQVEKFNKENEDGIEIEYEVKADNYQDLIKVSYQAGNAPDIHSPLTQAIYDAAVKNGWIRPLDDQDVKEYKELFLPGSLVPSVTDGKYYYTSVSIITFKFIWNKDLFKESGLDPEKPPRLWKDVREYAKIITQKGGGKKYGFALPLKDAIFSRYYVMIPGAPSGLLNGNGYDPKTGKFDFSIYKQMLQLCADMKKDGSLFPTPDTLNNDSARSQFSEGNIGMMTAATWDVGVFNDQFPAKNDWGVTDFPTFDGLKSGYAGGVGGGGFMMNIKTEAKEKQLTVWKWLISEPVLKELSLAGKGPFSLKSVNKPEFINKDKKGAQELGSVTEPMIILDLPASPIPMLKVEGDNWFTSLANIIIADKDIDKSLVDLTKRYNDALDKLEKSGTDVKRFIVPDYDPLTYRP